MPQQVEKVVGGQGHPLPGWHGTNIFFMPFLAGTIFSHS